MSKNFKLTEKMDLIEIYQKGKWNEFENLYQTYLTETKELSLLLEEFKETYFLTYNFFESSKGCEIIDNKYEELTGDICDGTEEWHDRKSEWLFKLRQENGVGVEFFLNNMYKSPTNIMEDPKISRLEYLSKKWSRSSKDAERLFKIKYLNNPTPLDNERLEFANRFLRKSILKVSFNNSLEEALDYGYPEVIDFIKNSYLEYPTFKRMGLYQYLGKKLKRIRCNLNLTELDLANELSLFEEDTTDSEKIKKIKAIENGRTHINIELLIKYSNYFNIQIEDIMGHNTVMEELVRVQKLSDEIDELFD